MWVIKDDEYVFEVDVFVRWEGSWDSGFMFGCIDVDVIVIFEGVFCEDI